MPEHVVSSKLPDAIDHADDEIHFINAFLTLRRYKRLLIGLPLLAGVIAFVVSMMLPPVYTSTAKIMPPQQQQGSGLAAVLGQLGGVAGAAAGIAGVKGSNDLYVGLLESRTVADSLIARFDLKKRYEKTSMDDTRRLLATNSAISNGKKDGFILVSANDRDPQFAADLANAYADELAKLTQTMALTEASQRRLFFEKQLKEAKEQLSSAEVALRTTQEKTGMIQPAGQVQAIINNAAQLKGTIAAKEVQLNSMRTFAARQNPDLLRAQEELRGLQEQLTRLESSAPSKSGDFMVPTGRIPQVGVEYVRGMRDVKYYETIFELLAKQFELAKIDEAKDSSLIQVLDRAVPAEHKTGPKRLLITIASMVAAAVLAFVLAFAHSVSTTLRRFTSPATR